MGHMKIIYKYNSLLVFRKSNLFLFVSNKFIFIHKEIIDILGFGI